MQIGQLLKKYRNNQGKTQQEWVHDIISRSFYAKVELGVHRIAAEDLFNILQYNNISVSDFLSELNNHNKDKLQSKKQLHRSMVDAYYQNSETSLKQIKKSIEDSDLDNKKELLVTVNAFIALVNQDYDAIDKDTQRIIQKIFFINDNFDKSNIILYCNFMCFYSFEVNLFMAKRIINRFKKTKDTQYQIPLLTIAANMIGFCIENRSYQEAQFFLNSTEQIPTRPESFFYKNAISFFKSIVAYHYDAKEIHLADCKAIIQVLRLNGMPEYSKELNNFFLANIESE